MPVFTSIGLAVGASAASAAAVGVGVTAGVAAVGTSISSSIKQGNAAKRAANNVKQTNAKAVNDLKSSQADASGNAARAVLAKRRARTQTTHTSPLGLTTEASVVRKTLTGE